MSRTLNFAIKNAKGKWIFKLDADDYINNNLKLEFVKHMKNNDFICGDLFIFNKFKKIKSKQYIKTNFLKYFNHPIGSGNLYKKDLWKKIKGYNEKLYYKDDVYFWSKIIKIKNIKIKYINKPCYCYRKHDKSMSKSFFKKYLTLFKIIIFN